MRYILTTLILLLTQNLLFSQHCPELGPDIVLPCGVNTAVLTADLTACAGTGPKETTTYLVTNIPFAPTAPGGTSISMTDDSQSGPYPIGFNFCFFGNTYTQFYIGSNGWISFSPGQPTTFTSAAIPSAGPTIPKNCIMGPWQDWHPGVGAGPYITYQTLGVAPCRKLVVSWTNCPMFSCTTTYGTFQIVLYEATNVIENHLTNKPNCMAWAGGTAVEGIHNLPGTIAFPVPGRNSTPWTATNDAWRWTPNGAPVTPDLTWYEVGNPTPIAINVNPITVTPAPGGTSYTCHLSYSGCFAGFETCNTTPGPGPDTILVTPSVNMMVVNMTYTDPVCFNDCNGTATATPVMGMPVYSYVWTPGGQITPTITGLCAGVYNVTVTDANGCISFGTVTLANPPQIIIGGPISHN